MERHQRCNEAFTGAAMNLHTAAARLVLPWSSHGGSQCCDAAVAGGSGSCVHSSMWVQWWVYWCCLPVSFVSSWFLRGGECRSSAVGLVDARREEKDGGGLSFSDL